MNIQTAEPTKPRITPAVAIPPPPSIPELRLILPRERNPRMIAGIPARRPQQTSDAIPATRDETAMPSLRLAAGIPTPGSITGAAHYRPRRRRARLRTLRRYGLEAVDMPLAPLSRQAQRQRQSLRS